MKFHFEHRPRAHLNPGPLVNKPSMLTIGPCQLLKLYECINSGDNNFNMVLVPRDIPFMNHVYVFLPPHKKEIWLKVRITFHEYLYHFPFIS